MEQNKLRYAGLIRRLVASTIDFILIILFSIVVFQYSPSSKNLFLLQYLLVYILTLIYPVYFHAKFGQTIGKKICKLMVINEDRTSLDFRTSLMRSSIDIGISFVLVIGILIGAYLSNASNFESMGILQRIAEFQKNNPLHKIPDSTFLYWSVIEVLVVLINNKRKSINDYIAGTVVIDISNKPENKKMSFLKSIFLTLFIAILFFISIFVFFSTEWGRKTVIHLLKSSGMYIQEFKLEGGQKYTAPDGWFSTKIINKNDIIALQNFDKTPRSVDFVVLPSSLLSPSKELCSENLNAQVLELLNSKIDRFSFNAPRARRPRRYDQIVLNSFQIVSEDGRTGCHLSLNGSGGGSDLYFIYTDPNEKSFGFILESHTYRNLTTAELNALFDGGR